MLLSVGVYQMTFIAFKMGLILDLGRIKCQWSHDPGQCSHHHKLAYTLYVYIYCATYNTQVCHYAPVQVRRADQQADDLPNTPSSKMSLIIKHKKFNNTTLCLFYCWAIFFDPLGSLTPTVTKSDLFFPCCVAGVKPRYSWIYHLLLNLKLTYTIFRDMQ